MDDPAQAMRDSYGFAVNKEYEEIYKNYASLYEAEEADRCKNWDDLLERFEPGVSTSRDAAAHEAVLEQIFIVAADNPDLEHHLKLLIQNGIPANYRGMVWKLLLDVRARKVEGEYHELVFTALGLDAFTSPQAAPLDSVAESSSTKSKATGVRTWAPPSKDWLSQIEKDLHRTFPGHHTMDEPGKAALRRVLSAYSVYNPAVGYCQGMNFVAGFLLLFLEEEDAFVSLCALVEEVLPGYYSIAMVQPQVDQRVFKALLLAQFPDMCAHLDRLGVDISCVFAQWFLSCFVNALPLESCLRAWDLLCLEGSSLALFRVSLGLVEIYSAALLNTEDVLDACELVQSMAPMTFDAQRLAIVAANAFAHITPSDISYLQTKCRAELMVDLAKAEENAKARAAAVAAAAAAAAAASPSPSPSLSPVPSSSPSPAARAVPAAAAAAAARSSPSVRVAKEEEDESSASDEDVEQPSAADEAAAAEQDDDAEAPTSPSAAAAAAAAAAGSGATSPVDRSLALSPSPQKAGLSTWEMAVQLFSSKDKDKDKKSEKSESSPGRSEGQRSESGSGKRLPERRWQGKATSQAFNIAKTPYQSPRTVNPEVPTSAKVETSPRTAAPLPQTAAASAASTGRSQPLLQQLSSAAGGSAPLQLSFAESLKAKVQAAITGRTSNAPAASAAAAADPDEAEEDNSLPQSPLAAAAATVLLLPGHDMLLDSNELPLLFDTFRAPDEETLQSLSVRYGVDEVVQQWRRATRFRTTSVAAADLAAAADAADVPGLGNWGAPEQLPAAAGSVARSAGGAAGAGAAGSSEAWGEREDVGMQQPSRHHQQQERQQQQGLEGEVEATAQHIEQQQDTGTALTAAPGGGAWVAQVSSTLVLMEQELGAALAERQAAEGELQAQAAAALAMAGKLEHLLRVVADREALVGALTDKLHKLLAEVAAQDNELAEKDAIIRSLQSQLAGSSGTVTPASSPEPGMRLLAGLNLGRARAGSMAAQQQAAEAAAMAAARAAAGSPTGEAGRWTKFIKAIKFSGKEEAAAGAAAGGVLAGSGSGLARSRSTNGGKVGERLAGGGAGGEFEIVTDADVLPFIGAAK